MTFKVGELAHRAGVSVRTLHHYEDIGLLAPSERTPAGHRLYGRRDLERLARIMGLTRLGLSLEEAGGCLNDERWSPLRLVEKHLERARAVLDEQRELCDRLQKLRENLLAQGDDDVESFIETVEVMNMIESYYTKEQLEAAGQPARGPGRGGHAQGRRRTGADLMAEAKAEMDRGTPPDAPAVQALARGWEALIAAFTGGDPGIAQLAQSHVFGAAGPEDPPQLRPEAVRVHGQGDGGTRKP